SNKSTWRGRPETLRCPHLMLADVGDNHAVGRQVPEQLIEEANGRLGNAARIWLSALFAGRHRSPAAPVRQGNVTQFVPEFRDGFGEIANDWNFASPYPIKLCRVNFEVNDSGVRREPGRLTGHTNIQ